MPQTHGENRSRTVPSHPSSAEDGYMIGRKKSKEGVERPRCE